MNAVPYSIPAAELFLSVVHRGSFAAAARDRNVDPSVISRQIKALEGELGFTLLERNTRRLHVTEAGRRFADRLEALLPDLRAAAQEALAVVDAPAGRLRITCSSAFGEHWLMPRLGPFRVANPAIALDLWLTDGVVDIAAEGVDLAIRHGPPLTGALIARKLMDTRYLLVATPAWLADHGPIDRPQELQEIPCPRLNMAGHRDQWQFFSKGKEEVRVAVDGPITLSTPAGLRAAALAGHGPALLAHWLVADDLTSGRLVQILPQWTLRVGDGQTAAWLVYPSRDYVPAKLRLFFDAMVAEATAAQSPKPPY
ncbi:MAG: LysR family transcriptional regulator [Pseudomonadota bacterium]